jgi:RNA recognition motif-containing protein
VSDAPTEQNVVQHLTGLSCSTTVFVSSLPYETTTTDLITHFSFIGPVKNGFVVKDRVNKLPLKSLHFLRINNHPRRNLENLKVSVISPILK